jgi:hypothetical protein
MDQQLVQKFPKTRNRELFWPFRELIPTRSGEQGKPGYQRPLYALIEKSTPPTGIVTLAKNSGFPRALAPPWSVTGADFRASLA